MTPLISDGDRLNGGIAVPGTPVAITFARSSSEFERRKVPRRRSMPVICSPFRPWHC